MARVYVAAVIIGQVENLALACLQSAGDAVRFALGLSIIGELPRLPLALQIVVEAVDRALSPLEAVELDGPYCLR